MGRGLAEGKDKGREEYVEQEGENVRKGLGHG